ncbi:murein transglycosylase A [Phyllobacterium myrsinacearum]|uniref:peptidoglycan lytic exotransglycosylase n=1 Tax=Phyllobacterium myrsinacearum TaxID=28101 RepID=A0A839EK28_9HYPH|nr:murein transglycosylase A [Phyllobacterium myrsinacearum]MBA8877846.1 membrane-bound lytic murein transglycosylase A [Phyllobacterium myrsinacearum]
MLSPLFKPVAFTECPGWGKDHQLEAFHAFRRSASRVSEKPYKSGSLGITFAALAPIFTDSRETLVENDEQARQFFEKWFHPARIESTETGHGFVTGFYEPEVVASPVRTGRYTVPFLSRPGDLVDVDDGNRPDGFDPYFAFARQTGTGLVEYFDRAAIESGALNGQNLEIAFVESPVDAFFIHVQGAARLKMTDGRLRRITYAAKTGHRFTGVGKILLDRGEIPLDEMSMQAIRAWLANHPEQIQNLLWNNRSYIFFREAAVDDASLGPIAAAKVPLTGGRSLAVDHLLHTFGTPFYIAAPSLKAFGGESFARLMIAQDTGSAIVGPARGDLFAGSGDAAGEIAGHIRHDADFFALVPRSLFTSPA